ncbi:MAG: ATP-grasp domain-containing protein [Planctomycetes bacterium]|nr:ATP-grasp domain-containing protein [Planctomycetota bacterium]MBI3845728.1 ATP-grasp domain-containing protein [Planctomycetota bacterium]
MKVLIIHDPCVVDGADSPSEAGRPDLDVPLISIRDALRSRSHDVVTAPVDEDVVRFVGTIDAVAPDVIVNLCEGIRGEAIWEVHVTALVQLMGVPFTGSGPMTLGACLDKERAKALLAARGIPTPRHRVFSSAKPFDVAELRFPLIVKPVGEDASVGIDFDGVVSNRPALEERVRSVCDRFGGRALVEEYVDGRELNVAILETGEERRVLPIAEIDFTAYRDGWPKILSYDAKWSITSEAFRKSVPVCPAPLSPDVAERVREVSLCAYETMGCTGYTRVDLRLDRQSSPFVLEVNPNPDLSPDAGFARAALVAGMTYPDLLEHVIEGALRTNRSSLRSADVAKVVG